MLACSLASELSPEALLCLKPYLLLTPRFLTWLTSTTTVSLETNWEITFHNSYRWPFCIGQHTSFQRNRISFQKPAKTLRSVITPLYTSLSSSSCPLLPQPSSLPSSSSSSDLFSCMFNWPRQYHHREKRQIKKGEKKLIIVILILLMIDYCCY